jgi:hypothetical protein
MCTSLKKAKVMGGVAVLSNAVLHAGGDESLG